MIKEEKKMTKEEILKVINFLGGFYTEEKENYLYIEINDMYWKYKVDENEKCILIKN